MEVEEYYHVKYKIEFTRDEIESLVGVLTVAKADWNTCGVTEDILDKLKEIIE